MCPETAYNGGRQSCCIVACQGLHGCIYPCAEARNVQNLLQVDMVQAWHSAKMQRLLQDI